MKEEGYKLLTESYVNGVSPQNQDTSNANLEAGEYVKFPNGSVAQVLGERHSKGGVNLNLPSYTKVLSDTQDLTITKKDARKFSKELDIKVTDKDTYSDVLDKYSRKIGYTKLINKETDIYKKAEKTVFGVKDENTRAQNAKFLSNELMAIQEDKALKEQQLGIAFEIMFGKQEEQKGTPEEELQTPVQENIQEVPQEMEQAVETMEQNPIFTEQEVFKYGGQIGIVEKLAKEHQIDARKVFDNLVKAGKLKELPKFNRGGLFTVRTNSNKFKDKLREDQSPNKEAYGDIPSAEEALNELYREFPLSFGSTDISNIAEIKDGKLVVKEGAKLNTVNNTIINLQKSMSNQMKSTAKFVKDNPSLFAPDTVQMVDDYLVNEDFYETGKKAQGYDGKLGNFTSGRFSLGVTMVTPEERKKLKEQGINTLQQLRSNLDGIDFLSDSTKDNIARFTQNLPKDADFTLDEYTPEVNNPTPPLNDTAKPVVNSLLNQTGGVGEDVNNILAGEDLNPTPRIPRRFFTPDFGFIPPDGLQAESMQSISLARINPLRVGIEDQLQSSNEARIGAMRSVEDLPQAQRAAFIASTLASTSQVEGDATTKASQINAQNQAQADTYNAGKYDAEQEYNNQSRLNYEGRTLRALDTTNRDFRNYSAGMHNAYLADLNRQMMLNTMDNMFPDIRVDNYGITGVYNPDRPYNIERQQFLADRVLAMTNRSQIPQTQTKKQNKSDSK